MLYPVLKSGVSLDGILSSLFLVLIIDYVMRRVAEETHCEIVWREGRKSEDLAEANDIVLIS